MKRLIGVILLLMCVGLMVEPGNCWQRKEKKTQPVYVDNGDTPYMFVVNVGTIVATAYPIVSSTTYTTYNVRKAVICNSEAFDLFVGTFSTVNATTSNSVYVPQNACLEVPYGKRSYWGKYESGAGAADPVHGMVMKDSRE